MFQLRVLTASLFLFFSISIHAATDSRGPVAELAANPHYLVGVVSIDDTLDQDKFRFSIDEMILGEWTEETVVLALEPMTAELIDPDDQFIIVFSNLRKQRQPATKQLVPVTPYLARLNVAGEAIIPNSDFAHRLLTGAMAKESGSAEAYVNALVEALDDQGPRLQRFIAAELYGDRALRDYAANNAGKLLAQYAVDQHNDPVARRLVLGVGQGPIPTGWAKNVAKDILRDTPTRPLPGGYMPALVETAIELLQRTDFDDAELLAPWLTVSHQGVAEKAVELLFRAPPDNAIAVATGAMDHSFMHANVRKMLRVRLRRARDGAG